VAAAIEKERQAVLASPRSADAWGQLGMVLSAYYFGTEALPCLVEAERLDPDEPRWPYYQAIVLLQAEPEAALPKLRRTVELCGDDPDGPRLRLAETLRSLGKLDEAEEQYRHLLGRDPANPWVRLGLGRIAWERGRAAESLPYLLAAAADPNTHHGASAALAEIYERQGDEAQAAHYRAEIERPPTADTPFPDPYVAEGQRLHVGERACVILADQYRKQGRTREAVAVLSEVVRDYPRSESAWYALGQNLHWAGDFPGAERAMQTAVELAPGFAEAHNYLGAARLRQLKVEDAAASFRKAIALKPDFAMAHYNLGRCLVQQKDRAAAAEAFRAAEHYQPTFAEPYAELAEVLLQDRKDAEAFAQARRALQLNPSDPRAKHVVEGVLARLPPLPVR
jgi:tetratricopeptide (TPR) repeat protein